MYYYKTKIQYIGSNFAGFQWQKDTPTIQSEFNRALASVIFGKFTTVAASRTDTGVHAIEQIVKISTENAIDLDLFIKKFNKSVSKEIICLEIAICSGQFRPSAQTRSKEYRYLFTNSIKVNREDQRFIANISNPLKIDAIKYCIEAIKGQHDFCNFYSKGSNVKSTIRIIFDCELESINPHIIFNENLLFHYPSELQNCYQLRIVANGFLKQMIRHIVSALWMVGSGKMTTSEFHSLLNGPKIEKQKWKVAPPNGLYLFQINYLTEKSEMSV